MVYVYLTPARVAHRSSLRSSLSLQHQHAESNPPPGVAGQPSLPRPAPDARRPPLPAPARRWSGESWLTAAIPVDNPCCSCTLTRSLHSPRAPGRSGGAPGRRAERSRRPGPPQAGAEARRPAQPLRSGCLGWPSTSRIRPAGRTARVRCPFFASLPPSLAAFRHPSIVLSLPSIVLPPPSHRPPTAPQTSWTSPCQARSASRSTMVTRRPP